MEKLLEKLTITSFLLHQDRIVISWTHFLGRELPDKQSLIAMLSAVQRHFRGLSGWVTVREFRAQYIHVTVSHCKSSHTHKAEPLWSTTATDRAEPLWSTTDIICGIMTNFLE